MAFDFDFSGSPQGTGRSPSLLKGQLLEYLLEKEVKGKEPMEFAFQYKDEKVIKHLLEFRMINPRDLDQEGCNLLLSACKMNASLKVIKYLIEEKGMDPNEKDYD